MLIDPAAANPARPVAREISAPTSFGLTPAPRTAGFVENTGQWQTDSDFVAQMGHVVIRAGSGTFAIQAEVQAGPDRRRGAMVTFSFSDQSVEPVGEGLVATTSNYFIGSDPQRWRSGLREWSALRWSAVAPGVDVRLHASAEFPEYDVLVAPGADLSAVRIAFDGVDGARLLPDGSLQFDTAIGSLCQPPPRTFAASDTGQITTVDCRYRLIDDEHYGFTVPGWSGTQRLLIDPLLVWSTFVGSPGDDDVTGIRTLPSGDLIVAGATSSPTFPTTAGAYDVTFAGGLSDIFVLRLDPSGSRIISSTFLGGSGQDAPRGLSVLADGRVFIAGLTKSPDFPTTAGAFDPSYGGGSTDGIVAGLSADGASLLLASYFGGDCTDVATCIDSWPDGSIVFGLETCSSNVPVTPQAFDPVNDGSGLLVAKLNPTGAILEFSTFIDGSSSTEALASVACANDGSVVVAGHTHSQDFPVTPTAFDADFDAATLLAFVSRLSSDGSTLLASTFFGGTTGSTDLSTMRLDADDSVFIAGSTNAADAPSSAGAWQPVLENKAYIAHLSADLSSLSAATGFTSVEELNELAVGTDGTATLVGTIQHPTLPATYNAYDKTFSGGAGDAFVAQFNSDLSQLLYCTYLGTASAFTTSGQAVAVEGSSLIIVAGRTSSPSFPVTPGTADTTYNGGLWDAFVAELDVVIPWVDLGGGVVGTLGIPSMAGSGMPVPGETLKLKITRMAPQSFATLILGSSELHVPLKGGILVPAPDAVVAGLFSSPAGTLEMQAGWPSGVPTGFSVWLQAWVLDPAAPAGFAATNALRLDVP